jgi:hypothetical protein
MTGQLHFKIAAGASLSGAWMVGNRVPVRIEMPAAWDAANLTFQTSHDGVTFQNKYDGMGAGAEFTVGAAAARNIDLNPADWIGVRWLKIRSGTAGTPVTQSAARDIYLITQEV